MCNNVHPSSEGVCVKLTVFINDISFTRVTDHWGKSISELAFESSRPILERTDTIPDAVIVSNAYSELTSSQSNLGPLIADEIGLENVEAFSVESSGASGAVAVHVASAMINAGQAKAILVVGVEKMRDIDPAKLVGVQGLAANAEYSQFFGISFAALNALLARIYMTEYSVSRENLSAFPVIAHRNSSTAEHAQFRKKFSKEEVSRSEVIADPIRVLDCAPVGDGAASILLVSKDLTGDRSIRIAASEASTFRSNIFERKDVLHFSSTESATRRALQASGKSLEGIDFAEIHDSYSILSALILEGIGISKAGDACLDGENGKFDLNGELPISTFGGMKGRGYPVGAAGVYQFCEAFMQMNGKAGPNQVRKANSCLLHNMSGLDESSYVHILTKN
jgi:acetyl-CoA C-acetyltransferase